MTTLEEVFLQLEDTQEDSAENAGDNESYESTRNLLAVEQEQPVNTENGRKTISGSTGLLFQLLKI